ncbi:MAG: Glycosyl transferase group 1 [Candidatus Daviesbacteria bacterium GW2011_GWA2_38_24]|uniref:Glycosyl transferase group 1 n=1 Tax=Candidatus Daviesbacteria bacterium GW2011_GWA2_38_24 TaxID=1618422 RepID=A0A0G0JHN6_9BACT|nr:MAG: Glycosyl transferase group 1 [Candidatus Daviesbacteria bacterium GW2011_GWA2_38_24]KKQ81047.1 MAG: Glycosyl transferase group 1 [Candidatus Daviesbacteria bacterium GW2011_GWA1_38_7]OGE23303.1 MAG: hypothetical protein A2688_04325 [Candidatus Daviesbacteria bacterium RIFCSPHIGHO2_01_FULL_38_8]
MKVGFDISQTAFIGGVSTYTKNLAAKFVDQVNLDLTYLYFSLRKPYNGSLPNVKKYPIPPTIAEVLLNRLRFPIENFIGDIDIFHSSDWVQPATKAKKVTTYHDVVPLKYPQWSHPKIIGVHKRRLEIVEKEVDAVIAVSEATKKDLLEVTKIAEEKIVVIYEAADEIFKPQEEKKIEEFRKKYNLPNDFVLSISGVGERRNLERIKEASKDYNLVISGEINPRVSYEEMPLLYCAAKVLLYPSLYEGFGLPILEAMSCGTPVITSNVSSMSEVGGDSAVYVDPLNVEEIKQKLKEVMEDNSLRQKLFKKGFVQAQKFSWEKCAKETADVYRKLVKNI